MDNFENKFKNSTVNWKDRVRSMNFYICVEAIQTIHVYLSKKSTQYAIEVPF